MKIPLILRCAAWFTPARERAEWLAEWAGELDYVRRTCGRRRALEFCGGAFSDALWMRRNHSPCFSFSLESPGRCLLFLSALAAASGFLALRSPLLHDPSPVAYRDAAKLAMVSRQGKHAPRLAEIPVEEYKQSAARDHQEFESVAFYTPRFTWAGSRQSVIALASPDLFAMLGVPTAGRGLILSRSAWLRNFHGDPRIVGSAIEIFGAPAVITGIISDAAWRLPGIADAWLLDEQRLRDLPPSARGFMVARLKTPLTQSGLHWTMSMPNDDGTYTGLTVAPLPASHTIASVVFLIGMAFALAAVTAPLGLGDYSANRHSLPWATRIRRWLFLGAKVALLAPIVLGGFLALIVVPLAPQGVMALGILALRWALDDQRNRCPVCLRLLQPSSADRRAFAYLPRMVRHRISLCARTRNAARAGDPD